MHKLEYKHYLFDFYGTLVDIRTDEDDPTLWLYLSRIYAAYGADYQPEDLKKKYRQLVVEQENKIAQEKGLAYPEIDLVAVSFSFCRKLQLSMKPRLRFLTCRLGESSWP